MSSRTCPQHVAESVVDRGIGFEFCQPRDRLNRFSQPDIYSCELDKACDIKEIKHCEHDLVRENLKATSFGERWSSLWYSERWQETGWGALFMSLIPGFAIFE